jgi:glucan endo-1,3-alpha-glucosidase
MRAMHLYIFTLCFLRPASSLPSLLSVPNSTPQHGASSKGSSAPTNATKFVFAHHIVGNTYNFTPSTWSSDVTLAHTSSIDGFALNIGNQPWEPARVQSAYDAAASSGTGFKMFLSLDMRYVALRQLQFILLICISAAQLFAL